jgi:hypothetical protein
VQGKFLLMSLADVAKCKNETELFYEMDYHDCNDILCILTKKNYTSTWMSLVQLGDTVLKVLTCMLQVATTQ